MPDLGEGTEEFDERRFKALLALAGPSNARELTSRLDADLSRVAVALGGADNSAGHQVLQAQSHVLVGIAGTIGANRLYQLSVHLNGIAKTAESGSVADTLGEIRVALDRLIAYVRLTGTQLATET